MTREDKKRINTSLLGRLMIIGVLAGLFFSNAEGIQLLPFPDAASTAVSQGEISDSFEISERYNPAIKAPQSSANQSGKIKRSDITPASAGETRLDIANAFSVDKADVSFRRETFRGTRREDHTVPRGPPAV